MRERQQRRRIASASASQGEMNVLMVSKVTPRQVVARMVNGSSVSFVDAREEQDWSSAVSKILGAVRAQLDSLVRDAARVSRSRLVVVYGADQRDAEVRSIAEALRGCGFPEVRILSGGFEAWEQLHFAIEPTSHQLTN